MRFYLLSSKNLSGVLILALLMFSLAVSPGMLRATPVPTIQTPTTTIPVDTFDDELDDGDGDCSLREAIQAANTNSPVDGCPAGSGGDVIVLPAGSYTLTLAGAGENGNATGDLDVFGGTVIINGVGAGSSIIDGNQLDRVLHVHDDASVTLNGVQITNGHAPDGLPGAKGDDGGGISNAGTLTLDHSQVSGNVAGTGGEQVGNERTDGGHGGGIYSSGALTITDSVVNGNRAGQGGGYEGGNGGHGGGIYNLGTLVVQGSAIEGNAAGSTGFSWAVGGRGGAGGGIYSGGTVTVTHSTIVGNTAGKGGAGPAGYGGPGGDGGGIYSSHTLVVIRSTIRNNAAGNGGGGDYAYSAYGGDGGGIYNEGLLHVAASTLSGNTAGDGGYSGWGYPGPAGTGGGIYSSAALTVTDSTISGNKAGDGGGVAYEWSGGPGGDCGGLDSSGSLALRNSTLSDNRPGHGGQSHDGPPGPDGEVGGICAGGLASVQNSIVAQSAPPSIYDCAGSVDSQGHNLVGIAGACVFASAGDLVGIDPLLGPLTDNGGDTFTHALLPGSPAVDQGSCPGITADQRDQPRPVDIPAIANADDGCDIGAYEYQIQAFDLWPAKTVNNILPDAGQRITFTIVVRNIGLYTATNALVSDTIPAGLTFIGPVTLDPPGAGVVGTPPMVAHGLTIAAGQRITLTFPVSVNSDLAKGVAITNTAAITSTEITTPRTSSVRITVRHCSYLPLTLRSEPATP